MASAAGLSIRTMKAGVVVRNVSQLERARLSAPIEKGQVW